MTDPAASPRDPAFLRFAEESHARYLAMAERGYMNDEDYQLSQEWLRRWREFVKEGPGG